MRRRSFLTSSLGLVAGGAARVGGGIVRAQRARAAQSTPAGGPRGRWISPVPGLAPIPEPMPELAGAAVNGKLYASQGQLPGFKPGGQMYEYDPARDAWTKKKPMPHPFHHSAVTVFGGKVYFFGGFVLPESGPPGWVPVNDAWEYDPGTDAWRTLAPMPTKRGAAMAAEAGGKLYAIGGAGPIPGATDPAIRPGQPQRSLNTVEEYDPATNGWRARAPMPTACNHLGGGR